MAVPSTGPVGLSDISAEFGGAPPESLSEYYAGGGLVPSGATGNEGAVPTSGTISINSLRGAVNEAPITATGGTISDSGGYRYHTFTSSGTFTVTAAGAGDSSWTDFEAEILGGGGGTTSQSNESAGGGGGGGRTTNTATASVQSYSVVVGGGGPAGNASGGSTSGNGGNSSFNGTTALGGGRGWRNRYTLTFGQCNAGGCGGGHSASDNSVRAPGSQGGDGGKIVSNTNGFGSGGGGAGGNAADVNYPSTSATNGGPGISMFGTVRGGGGGGATNSGGAPARGLGGSGGGGNGGYFFAQTNVGSSNGTNAFGGGGGGRWTVTGGGTTGQSGGSGIVIIRYRIS